MMLSSRAVRVTPESAVAGLPSLRKAAEEA
jgi:hypothetical protein